jgi:hypothetical protein
MLHLELLNFSFLLVYGNLHRKVINNDVVLFNNKKYKISFKSDYVSNSSHFFKISVTMQSWFAQTCFCEAENRLLNSLLRDLLQQ